MTSQLFSRLALGGFLSTLLFALTARLIGEVGGLFASIPLMITAYAYRGPLPILAIPYVIGFFGVGFLLGFVPSLIYLVYVSIPAFVIPQLALQSKTAGGKKHWYPQANLVGVLGLYALTVTALFFMWWQGFSKGDEVLALLQAKWAVLPLETHEKLTRLQVYLKAVWPYVPGVFAVFFVLISAWCHHITQNWYKRRKIRFPRPKLAISDLYLPWWCWKAGAVLGVLWAVAYTLDIKFLAFAAGNLVFPVIALFVLQGLAIIFTFTKKQKTPSLFLVILYGSMLVFGWPLLIVILLGVFEPWLNVRERLKDAKKNGRK